MVVVTVTPNPAVDVFTSTERMAPFTKLRCSAPHCDAGGGGVNVARVVKRLGGDSVAVFPSGGTSGTLLRQLLDRENVRADAVPFAGETRQNFTVYDRGAESQYQFVLPGPDLPTETWQACLEKAKRPDAQPGILVGSGSLPGGVPSDFYARLSAIAKGMGARAIIDCAGAALRDALEEGVFLIKPNLREFQELIGRKVDEEGAWVAAGRSLIRQKKTEYVALTLGAGGALLIGSEIALRAEGVPLKPASVIGAGDSFVGALAFSIAAGDSIQTAFGYAMAAGTAATLNAGTELCRVEDVRRLLTGIVVRSA